MKIVIFRIFKQFSKEREMGARAERIGDSLDQH